MSETRSPTSRAKLAYDLIRRDILNGSLVPRSKLMIADLQKRYDLGAMPLREALNRLSAEMLVEKHEQRGFSVPPIDLDAYMEVQSARIVIETQALRQSIEANLPGWEEALVLGFHRLKKAGPKSKSDASNFLLTEQWSEAHHTFHRALITGCENTWLLTFAEKLYEQSSRFRMLRRHISTLRPPARATLMAEHSEIMEAALDGDAQTAVDRLVDHYRLSVELVLGTPIAVSETSLRLYRADSAAERSDRELGEADAGKNRL